MSEQRRINQLNRRFAEAFGSVTFGNQGEQPRYKWVHTTAMDYWIRDSEVWADGSVHGKRDFVAMPTGLILTVPVFKKEYWAQIYGSRYVVAVWTAPISEAQHENTFGPKVPWANAGAYQPIETLLLNPSKIPTEENTALAINIIRANMGMTEEQYKREGDEIVEQQNEQALTRIGDEMDDLLDTPTLRNGKGSTSFMRGLQPAAPPAPAKPLIVLPN